ncbi:MAG: ion channel, partial [Planctomycetota bacterium]
MRRRVSRINVPGLIAAVFAVNGFLNLVTGLLPILGGARAVGVEQVPAYLRVTPARQISGVVSIFLGVLMIALGRGLYQRRRAAWWWAVGLLVALALNNLIRGTTPQTGILSALVLIALLLAWRRFDVRSAAPLGYGQVIALASVLFALAYGIVGSHLMRAQFSGLETWTDSIYYTFVTYSTLGYGDILPTTPDARLF